jgi:hypothetical protein
MNNKPITSRVQHATKGGMVREPLLSVGSVAKQKPSNLVEDKTNEGKELGLGKGQSYVEKDNKIMIKTDGSPGSTTYTPPKRTTAGDAAYEALTPEQRKAQDAKYIKKNTKTIPGTPDKFDDIPSSTPGTPGTDAVKEKRGDAFTSYQQRNVLRKGQVTNRKSKKGGKKELKEEKKQLKAGLKAATGANFFERTFGTGKGKEYKENVKRFNKGQFDEIAVEGKDVSKFGYSADEATAKKKVALGEGFDLNKYTKSAGDHIQKQTSQGIRGKSTMEQTRTGGTNDNRVVTQEGKAAVAGTEGTTLGYTPADKESREKFNVQKRRGYAQAPKTMAMKALIGNQKNLPNALKAKILKAPESAAKNYNNFGSYKVGKGGKK